jgi:hypothetical protein
MLAAVFFSDRPVHEPLGVQGLRADHYPDPMFTCTPFVNKIFQSCAISGKDRIMIVAIAVAASAVIGFEKRLRLYGFEKVR